MSTAAVLLPNQNLQFAELAKALVTSFIDLGWSAMWLGDKDLIREYAREIDLAIVMTPFDYKDIHKLLPRATRVLYQLEVMPWPQRIHLKRRKDWGWDKLQFILPQYDVVWDFDLGNVKHHWCYFQRRPVFHVPIGYSPVFELGKRVKQRKIALFIGSNNGHRKRSHRSRACRLLQDKLKPRFGVITGRYGDKARQAAKNAMININIHQRWELPVFETHRIVSILMSNRCFVITEPCKYMGPFKHQEHLVVADTHDMPAEVKYYWETPWERERIAKAGYKFIKKHYTMTEHLSRVLKEI